MDNVRLAERSSVETERRFLVSEADAQAYHSFAKEEIEQGYLIAEPGNVLRVRIVNGKRVKIERKIGEGLRRVETSLRGKMTGSDARFLLDACQFIVRKTRYLDPERTGWHIEELHGRFEGDLIAEYEGEDAAGVVSLPPYITRAVDVTDTLNALKVAQLARVAPPGARLADFVQILMLPRVSIEGGPGSGKSDLVRYIAETLPDLFVLPETPRMLFTHSGLTQKLNGGMLYDIATQQAIFGSQRALEDACAVHASLIGCRGIVFDRGTPGGIGYLPRDIWEVACGTTIASEHRRYNLVVIMDMPSREIFVANQRRAVEGRADKRIEDYDLALVRHNDSVAAWDGHPNAVHIPAADTWEEKRNAAIAAIDTYLAKRG